MEENLWYAMRATYGRNMTVRALLEGMGVEVFVPMRYTAVRQGRALRRRLVPVIRDLIFVHATASTIKAVKAKISYLHYITRPEAGRNVPIIVPDEQMEQFVAIAGTCDEQLQYFDPAEINLTAGQRVRIHGGAFDGREGIFVKVAGARARRVVVAIDGVIAVAMVTTDVSQIEPIE